MLVFLVLDIETSWKYWNNRKHNSA